MFLLMADGSLLLLIQLFILLYKKDIRIRVHSFILFIIGNCFCLVSHYE